MLLSDNKASDYSQTMLESLTAIGERLRAVAPQPDLAWVDALPTLPQAASSRGYSRAEPSLAVAVTGQVVPWLIEARVEGMDPAQVDLQLEINGEVRQRQTVAVRGGVATAVLPVQLDRVGRHAIETSVLPSDAGSTLATRDSFPADDTVFREFRVVDPIGVWLVDGKTGAGPLQSDTDFLALALSPFALSRQQAADDQPVDLFRTQKRRPGRLIRKRPMSR